MANKLNEMLCVVDLHSTDEVSHRFGAEPGEDAEELEVGFEADLVVEKPIELIGGLVEHEGLECSEVELDLLRCLKGVDYRPNILPYLLCYCRLHFLHLLDLLHLRFVLIPLLCLALRLVEGLNLALKEGSFGFFVSFLQVELANCLFLEFSLVLLLKKENIGKLEVESLMGNLALVAPPSDLELTAILFPAFHQLVQRFYSLNLVLNPPQLHPSSLLSLVLFSDKTDQRLRLRQIVTGKLLTLGNMVIGLIVVLHVTVGFGEEVGG